MRIRRDGSVQSGATPTLMNVGREDDMGLYRCMVTKVIYADDAANITANSQNPRVLYDVVVIGGFASGQVISNCRVATDLGSNNSYEERTLRASNKELSKDRLSDCDGEIVYVQFNQGHTGFPVIVRMDQGIKTGPSIAATKAQGPRKLTQFNGVEEQIDKDGVVTQKVKGGTADSEQGAFEPAAAPVITTTIDPKLEKIIRTFKSGLSITEDGKSDKVTVTTKGGATILIDGTGGKITISKGSTSIEIDGNADKISLKGGFIDLGSSVSDFAVLFTELLTAFNTHTHLVPQAPAGMLPSQPPIAPMLQTVGSQTVKVQP
jgi:hypothetical protein